MTKKTISKLLENEADARSESNLAFALAVINEGLKPVAESEEDLDRPTAVESIAARLWLSAAQGDMKAIAMLRDTLDGLPTQKIEQKVDVTSRTEHDAMIGRISQSLLTLRPVTIEQVAPEKKLLN